MIAVSYRLTLPLTASRYRGEKEVNVGEVLNTKYGKCTIINIVIRPPKSTRYDVKFEDGEYCRYAKWQLAQILLP